MTSDLTERPIAEVQAQIARADTKASILFGLSLAALTGGAAVAGKAHLPPVAVVFAALTAALIAAALVLLGAAIRPALRGNYGFVRWAAAASVADLHADLASTEPAEVRVAQLWLLALSADRKYRRVRLAIDLLGAALATAALTATLDILG